LIRTDLGRRNEFLDAFLDAHAHVDRWQDLVKRAASYSHQNLPSYARND